LDKIFIIVLGYEGLINKKYPKYKNYLKFIREFVNNKISENYIIIASGGHTNRNNPGLSEAKFIRDFLVKRNIPSSKIILEDNSLDKEQNIKYSVEMIEKYCQHRALNALCIYIFCDSIQKLQLEIDINKLDKNYDFRIIGYNFKRSFFCKICELFAIMKDYLSKYFPFIEHKFIEIRKKQLHINHKNR